MTYATRIIFELKQLIQRGINGDRPIYNLFGGQALIAALETHDSKNLLLLLASGARLRDDGSSWFIGDAFPVTTCLQKMLSELFATHSKLQIFTMAKRILLFPISDQEFFQAKARIAQVQVELIAKRALQVCVGLHFLRLDALQMCEVLIYSCGPMGNLVPFHIWWKIATTVKHFRQRKQ